MIGGSYCSVRIPTKISETSDIAAHLHPLIKALPVLPSLRDVINFEFGLKVQVLPSLADVFSVNLNAKNFVMSCEGLTCFTGIKKHPITGKGWCPENFTELEQLWFLFEKSYPYRPNPHPQKKETKNFYQKRKEDFLEKMGVVVIQKTWQELPDKNPLSQFPFRRGV